MKYLDEWRKKKAITKMVSSVPHGIELIDGLSKIETSTYDPEQIKQAYARCLSESLTRLYSVSEIGRLKKSLTTYDDSASSDLSALLSFEKLPDDTPPVTGENPYFLPYRYLGITKLINLYFSSGDYDGSYYLSSLVSLSEAMKTVIEKYNNHQIPGNTAAIVSGPEIILKALAGLGDTLDVWHRRNPESLQNLILKDVQMEAILATMFLQYQHADEIVFWPRFTPDYYSTDRWLTLELMTSPSTPDVHRDAYLSRLNRCKELETMFSGDVNIGYNSLCDYSDENLSILLSLKKSNIRVYWHVVGYLAEEEESGVAIANELLKFGRPYLDTYKAFFVAHAIKGLRLYPGMPNSNDYTVEAEEIQAKSKALLHGHFAIRELYSEFVWTEEGVPELLENALTKDGRISDSRIADLLTHHPECAEQVATIIKEHKTVDFTIISKEISCLKFPSPQP